MTYTVETMNLSKKFGDLPPWIRLTLPLAVEKFAAF